ncbi:hypothetical protein DCS32_00390 [Dokdonia sp. Dokd-P16]|uniref:hypothetical protein n=1 Tax=Dokdonia sp. Dokd-P16 TaxID=2173169 RepID=UPI000D544944|nr:hypothetical protein [Dokdonia sp. Dokd-P16]AWH72682.1 hypothetical protein DCS32_00390 [Dokdonia sp. Dokd-P16]
MRLTLLNILIIAVLSYFLIADGLILKDNYHENTFEHLIEKKVISDSLNWNRKKAKITVVSESYGRKHFYNKVLLGVEYNYKTSTNRKAYNLIEIPYLLLIGTTKKVGDSVDIIYNDNIEWSERVNAIYLPSKKDLLDKKMISGIRLLIMLIFLVLFIRDERKKKKS